MEKATTNQVRQILMNELGLTRETVREEMTKIIEAEAKKAVTNMVNYGALGRVVNEKVERLFNSKMGGGEAMKFFVEEAATELIKEYVSEHVVIKP